MTPTPDTSLAARLAKLVQDEKYAADFQARSDAVTELRERLENAFDDGQLITLADHTAAVAKAVEASLKLLVWTEDSGGFYGEGHFDAMFRIGKREAGFHIGTSAGVGATLKTLDAAKAFYQREYAEYVLAAFDTAAIRARKGDAR